ncbi:ORF81R [Turbot reddish body iridovirus]|uniref:ORF81R n=1 Tax=Turbot reddish body iridovirus TaxID=273651 RepID=E2CU26_ISKNV|nr:ORF81R [Turbot reddish body iridovirus]
MSGTSNSPPVATAVMAGGLTTLGMRLRFNMCSCIWLRLPKSLCTSASLLPDTVRLRALHSSLSLTTGSLLRSSIFPDVVTVDISTLDDNQKWKWTFAVGHSRGVL